MSHWERETFFLPGQSLSDNYSARWERTFSLSVLIPGDGGHHVKSRDRARDA